MYEKRVCVLKQVKRGFSADGGDLTGAVYLERMGEELTVSPRVLGLAPVSEGRYVLVLWIKGETFCLTMNGAELHVERAPSLKVGFAALVCFVRGEAEPVAFGSCGAAPAGYAPLLAALTGKKEGEGEKERELPTPLPPNEVPFPATPNAPRAPTVPLPGPVPEENGPFRGGTYDDEAIAATDYFRAGEARKDENAAAFGGEEAEKIAGGGNSSPHEAHLPRGSLAYYNSVRERLEEAMRRYPPDERLKAAFPLSEWVRAESGALLGVVYEHGLPRYLCVASEKAFGRPAQLGDACVFVPTSQGSDEEGFWVVFQDADTGDYVEVYDT